MAANAELAKLRALYDKAKAGEGQVLLVEGEAGIGKSRLLDDSSACSSARART